MAEGVRKAQLHHLISQQPQGPMIMPFGRGRTRYRNHLGALLFGQLGGGSRPWSVLQGCLDRVPPAKLQNALDKAAGSLPRSNICTFS
jgi:hypothetical protein